MFKIQSQAFGQKNKKIIFLLAGWGNSIKPYWLFAKILQLHGYHVIVYVYDKEILSPHIKNTVTNFILVRDTILKKIYDLKKLGHTSFYFFGTSIGTTLTLMVANKNSDISKIILNLTGADLVETVWGWGDRLNPEFKKGFQEQNITLPELRNHWKQLNPINNVENLKATKLLVYLAENDDVIPYRQGLQLLLEFKKRKYSYSLLVNKKLRHVSAGALNLLKWKIYIDFLNR